jgi:hypothetical protein
MKKTVVIHQPDFLPYLGFFHRLLHADLLVLLDHVQFVHSNRSWTHRDKIKTPQGAKWITLSVEKAPRDTPINQIKLSQETDWKTDNLNLIQEHYRRAPYYAEVFPAIERLYAYECTRLVDFTIKSLEVLISLFDIPIPIRLASALDAQGSKNDLLVDILKKVEASHYLSGIGAKAYFEPETFRTAGIEVVWQYFSHPSYPQLYGDFVGNLSSIDLLFNCGIAKSRTILRSC